MNSGQNIRRDARNTKRIFTEGKRGPTVTARYRESIGHGLLTSASGQAESDARENRIDGARIRANISAMSRALVVALVALLPAGSALAQKIESAPIEAPTESHAPKKMPASLDQLKPTPAPTTPPAPAIAANLPKRTPEEIVGQFFDALKADRVDAAYDTLNAEFAMADRADESKTMRAQTQKALDAYGPVLGYEMIREEPLGTHLLRRTYVLTGEQLPLRWKFYFYKPTDRWKLIDLRIDDAIVEWFDEAARTQGAAKKPAAP